MGKDCRSSLGFTAWYTQKNDYMYLEIYLKRSGNVRCLGVNVVVTDFLDAKQKDGILP